MDETKDILDCILYTINGRANDATKNRYAAVDGVKEEFFKGQYLAYAEVYQMILNTRNNLTE